MYDLGVTLRGCQGARVVMTTRAARIEAGSGKAGRRRSLVVRGLKWAQRRLLASVWRELPGLGSQGLHVLVAPRAPT